jgi:hypothetical protein
MSSMGAYFKLNLRAVWIMVALLSLTLPVFIPSTTNSPNFLGNVIGTATATMFILSFPSSLFALPALFFAQVVLGYDANTIGGMYVNLCLLFSVGFVQWFWIVPRLLGKRARFQTLNLPRKASEILPAGVENSGASAFHDRHNRTPLERIIIED